jgi:AraC-like DNA-binding protein
MLSTSAIDLNVRSYGPDLGEDRHDFVQLVLPLSGAIHIDIAGQADELAPGRAALVGAGVRHSQLGEVPNRSLILDLGPEVLNGAARLLDRLGSRPFVSLSPASSKLIDFMGLQIADGGVAAPTLQLWTPLLLDSLAQEPPRPRSRLAALLAWIRAEPASPWTAAAMARRTGVSVSQLHALFRSELGTTPRAWLGELRLKRMAEQLAQTDLPIAELAYRGGYSDQSALTRAMKRATGLTPAAYRRRCREMRPLQQQTRSKIL